MPKAYDCQQLRITHHPTQRTVFEHAKLPTLDPLSVIDGTLAMIKAATGIDLTGLKKLLDGVAALFGLGSGEEFGGQLDPAHIWTKLIQTRITPLGLLAELVDGRVPDSQGPASIQAIVDHIFDGYNNHGTVGDPGNDVDTVLRSVFGIFRTGLTANSLATQLAARVAALESSANTIVLDFAGPSSPTLGPGWEQDYSGIGGSLGLDGAGNAVWKPLGAAYRACIARYTSAALPSDNGMIQAVLASSPQSPAFDEAYTDVCFRMNTTNTTCVRLRIGYDTVRLQALVNGVATNIGPVVVVSPKAGDLFEVSFGDSGGTGHRHFVVRHQGSIIIDFIDPSVSQYGPSYRHVGIGMQTGNRLVFFQNIPASLSVVTAGEVP